MDDSLQLEMMQTAWLDTGWTGLTSYDDLLLSRGHEDETMGAVKCREQCTLSVNTQEDSESTEEFI